MSTHVVVKPLPTSEGVLAPGTEVDASTWRNTAALESLRYIKPIQPDERTKRVGRKEKEDGHTRN